MRGIMLFLIVFASHLFILGVGGAAVCIAATKLTRRKRAQIKENEE
jgi:cell division protein FtsB